MKTLTLPFLGQRRYLQGTTLLDALLKTLEPAGRFSFKAVQPLFTNRVGLFLLGEPGAPAEEECSAQLFWTGDGGASRWGVTGLEPVEPVERQPFDEQALCGQAKFGTGEVRWDQPADESLIRRAVSYFKVLLGREQTGGGNGQWLFLRLDATAPLPGGCAMRLCRLPGKDKELALARIFQGDSPFGVLYFSWRELAPPPKKQEAKA